MYARIRRALARGLAPVDRLFNRLFASERNPLYRSGTLAVAFLAVATLTGLYLIFFYRLDDPHGSVLRLNEQAWLGRWIRALHRHASAAAVLCTLMHALRVFVQGRSWGRRALAWISGLGLLLLLWVTVWTGYLLVWDQSAQALNLAFVRMVDALGISASPLSYSFRGVPAQPQPSFFFMVLFLHVVLPLALVFVLWLHTSRMARARWFPARALALAAVGLLVAVSVWRPAPLTSRADLLRQPAGYRVDLWSTAWVPWAQEHPRSAVAVGAGLFLLLVSLPFWLRPPRRKQPAPSTRDPDTCIGCGRCAADCPYEAIQMVPREAGEGSGRPARISLVDPDRCVSCGICSGACPVLTIGPPGRKASDQIHHAERFLAGLEERGADIRSLTLLLACRNQPESMKRIERFAARQPHVQVYGVYCGGTLHPEVLDLLASRFGRTILVACPPRNCTTRDGFLVLEERLSGVRTHPRYANLRLGERIELVAAGDGEEYRVESAVLGGGAPRRVLSRTVAALAGLALVVLSSLGSAVPVGGGSESAAIRLSWRLTGQRIRHVRVRSAEELAAMPVHMRTPEEHVDEAVPFRLEVELGGKRVLERSLRASGLREDGPLYVAEELAVPVGRHQVEVRFYPDHPGAQDLRRYRFEGWIEFGAGDIVLLAPGEEGPELQVHRAALPGAD